MTTEVNLKRSSRLSGALWLSIAQAVVLALGYVTHILVGKIGGPSLYGVYGLTLSFLTIMNMLMTLGIPTAVSKEVAENESNSGSILKTALFAQIIFSFLLSLLTLIFAGPAAKLLGDPSLANVIRFTAVVYPLTALYSVQTNYLNGLHAFSLQATLIVIYALAKLTGSVGLLFPFGVQGAVAGFAIGGLVAAIFGLPFTLRSIRGHFKTGVPLKKIISFAGAFVGTSLALQILMSTDLFLVKRIMQDNTLAGYYNAASTLSRIPYFILQALGFVFLPSIARLMKENENEARQFIRDIFRYLFLLLLPITALAATTSKSLIHLFYSPIYEPAASPLTLLMIALGLLSAFYLLATIAAGAGKARIPLIISWVLIPVAIAFGFFFIPRFGLEGAAITTISTAGIGALIIGSYMVARFRLSFPVTTLIKGVIATTVMVLPTYFLALKAILLPLEYLFLFAVYAITLIALGELKKDDISRLKTLVPKKIRGAEEVIIES